MSDDPHYTLAPGPDVDLDTEDVRLADGTRLTNERAAQIAQEELGKVRRGRPTLSPDDEGEGSPQLSVRVPGQVRRRVEDRATAEGRKVSDVVRDAIEQYLAGT